ncbi:MAG TPA: hypothetical protein VMI56_23505 [Reyranella sp.]|nr:hypothetical protein [Reyranella sp.]
MRAAEESSADTLWSPALDEGSEENERKRFEDSFEAALQQMERSGRGLDPWQEENLLSALGAAAMRSWALAAAFVATATTRPPGRRPTKTHNSRRVPLPLSTLRRRFEQICAAQ